MYCPNCNMNTSQNTSAYCPICSQPEIQHKELKDGNTQCPSCFICKAFSIYGGEYIGYPSKHDGEYICAECLARLIDEAVEIENILKNYAEAWKKLT